MCARVLLPGADADERGLHARMDRLERRVGMMGDGEQGTKVADWDDVGEPTQRIETHRATASSPWPTLTPHPRRRARTCSAVGTGCSEGRG